MIKFADKTNFFQELGGKGNTKANKRLQTLETKGQFYLKKIALNLVVNYQFGGFYTLCTFWPLLSVFMFP
jgi:hypothetical protein